MPRGLLSRQDALSSSTKPLKDFIDLVNRNGSRMPESSNNRDCVIVALRQELTLAYGGPWPLKTFRLGDTAYRDAGLGDWTGFYDWLRHVNGELIGIRYSPLADNRELFEAALELSYTRSDGSNGLEIYFDSSSVADESQSCDQEFQYDAVFRSADGGWAIAFDTVALTAKDRQFLRTLVSEHCR